MSDLVVLAFLHQHSPPITRYIPLLNKPSPPSTMATQTVFRLTSRNGPDGLQAFQEPVPTAAKYEVLVKIRSVSLNYRDIAIANSTYPQAVKDQLIPCSDMAGEVVQVGDAVTGFSVGDGVITPVSTSLLYGPVRAPTGKSYDSWGGLSDGMLREYVAIPAHMAIKLPESSHSFTQWSCLPGTVSTVWNAFYGNKRLMPGDIVLLQGMLPVINNLNYGNESLT